MNKKKDSLTPLRDVISEILGDKNLPFNPKDALIWQVWDEVVGPTVSKYAQPSWIKDGLLRVKVSDPIWLQELRFLEGTIVEKLNQRLNRKALERIDFRLRS
ncbi:MAG: DUF721 domain-containing protein [Deltaproteobacteria bacterium]|nr:DUF721 domain-containing protein [Deltaproteobacteria bacterium]MBW2137494.1 DUF721 domain-containing protein [Deltaproteobacteria bacterium]